VLARSGTVRVMAQDDPRAELAERARRLAADLNLTTMGWRIPSERIVEDFAPEQRLRAQEHELSEVEDEAGRRTPRRAFSIYDADERPRELVGLLLEPERGGSWRLLLSDGRRI
jgi:hypothetical protein